MPSHVRPKLLEKFRRRPHRYRTYRFLTQATTLAILFLVPLTGLARFDVWGGEHRALLRAVGPFEGFVAVTIGVASLYLITFVANFVCGRLFCGWGCPVAQISRFGEALDGGGWRVRLEGAGFAALLVLSVMLWWTSPRLIVEGSWTALGIAALVFLSLFALAYLHGRVFRWEFCKKACPIGLYYSVVATETSHGIIFEKGLDTCKECDLCDRICPVELHPRELSRQRIDLGGLAIDGLLEDNHCLRCGDCVTACENVFARENSERVPLHFGLGRKGVPLVPRASDESSESLLEEDDSRALSSRPTRGER